MGSDLLVAASLNNSHGSEFHTSDNGHQGTTLQVADCSNCSVDQLVNSTIQITPECSLYRFIINTVIIGTICIVGLFGNITSFIVFWHDKVKTSSSFLFQALSLIDCILLILVLPLYAVTEFALYTDLIPIYENRVLPFAYVYILPCAFVAQTATIWVTVLVGVNRYIAVCKPYQAPKLCTVAQAKKQLLTVLVFTIIYNVPKFMEGTIEWTTTDNITYTAEAANTEMGGHKLYQIIYSNIFYAIFVLTIPLLILTVLNVRLIMALNELKRKRAEMQSLRQQQDNNVTLVLVVVIIVFSVCQFPALVNQVLWNTLSNDYRECGFFQFYFRPVSNALVIFNSAVNFFIYFMFNTRFRQVLTSLLCKDKDYEKVRTVTSTTNDNHHVNNANSKKGKDTTTVSLL